jgi:hypothetical protein
MSLQAAIRWVALALWCLAIVACATPSSTSSTKQAPYWSKPQGRLAQSCASDGSPCSDPNNPNPQYPVCQKDCCSSAYHECDGIACICGSGP